MTSNNDETNRLGKPRAQAKATMMQALMRVMMRVHDMRDRRMHDAELTERTADRHQETE